MTDQEIKEERLKTIYLTCIDEMRDFRSSATNLFIGFITLSIVSLGYILSNIKIFNNSQKIIITIGLLVICFVYLILLKSMNKYFLNTATVLNKIDKIYGSFDHNNYIPDSTLFPKEWETFGKSNWKEPVFIYAKIGSITLTAINALALWI